MTRLRNRPAPLPGRHRDTTPAPCLAIRRLWLAFGNERYEGPAGYATQRVPVFMHCEVKGPHDVHVGPGGVRWA